MRTQTDTNAATAKLRQEWRFLCGPCQKILVRRASQLSY
jgi:hypothetical protein